MSVFLSNNNIKPYNTLVDLRKETEMSVSLTSGSTVIEDIQSIYIVFTDLLYNNIEIKVENENSSGASLYISPVDGVGTPTHWGKLIQLSNINATENDVKVLIKYRWSVINNIYILKRLNVSGNINIYEV